MGNHFKRRTSERKGMKGAAWIINLELLHELAGIAFVCTSCSQNTFIAS
jgi:hypothetical protein